ncbi:DUF3768 domain-containing protein [Aurantimonas sp. DM33-3]|uniref:DUF3768 domain-containing protein n=1 Tax=Aurantimonas sp. DM33-3 TaxID=2766955 RepID=UPI001651F601|nr:DUF3768 domain-containing protein [Aurantimonas sp. DM33-3]MBC6718670.1 DUF3768 domain-containing protein [Aurantimonas sp. DM33-3]
MAAAAATLTGEATRGHIDRDNVVRRLNDSFRRTFAGGTVMLTAGVRELDAQGQRTVLDAVRAFDTFGTDNDPYGEHDFGAVEHGGHRYFWKIDYYDRDLTHGSPDPADPTVTSRVLTIMRADEY